MLHSCQNCWFNGLQYGPLGLAWGYCVRHRVILNKASQTTCRQQMRKDLALPRALQVSELHALRYPADQIVSLHDNLGAVDAISSDEADLNALKADQVAEVVTDYGELGTTIASLAQLHQLSKLPAGARAEMAMATLGRGYVRNCVRRGGAWTSGLHLWWWMRRRLDTIPEVVMSDILWTGGLPLARQIKLMTWSVIMLRLSLLDDIAHYAAKQDQPLVNGLLQGAAEAAPNFNAATLVRWLNKKALPELNRALPWERYKELAQQLNDDGQAPPPATDLAATAGDIRGHQGI